jgi:hypothetical protein
MNDFLPYFSGYIDGDGHFRFKKYFQNGNSCYTCKIMVTSTEIRPLILFCEKIGGSFYKKAQPNPLWKQEYIYTLHVGKEKFELIKNIGMFLNEKKSQFDLVKEYLYASKEERDVIIEKAKELRKSNMATIKDFKRIKSLMKSIPVEEEDYIYLSGYIDAECCLTVTKTILTTGSASYTCMLRAGVTKLPCIEFLCTRFGGHLSYKKASRHHPNDCFEWGIGNKALEGILPKICGYLVSKRSQCESLIALRKTYESKVFPRDKHFSSYYNQVTPTREQIYKTVKSLNKRGTQAD